MLERPYGQRYTHVTSATKMANAVPTQPVLLFQKSSASSESSALKGA